MSRPEKTGNLPIILLIDDDDLFIKALTKRLENEGFNVVIARSGDSAVSVLKLYKETIDIILMDILLPRVKGFKILEDIKKETVLDGQKIPFLIIYTNIKSREEIDFIKKVGIDEYLVKTEAPFDYLVDKIKKMLKTKISNN